MYRQRCLNEQQVNQTAARGRNRLAEFTGESWRAYRRGRDVPPVAKGDLSRSRPGFNAARMFGSAALATH